MASGSLSNPFKKQEETPMKQVSGQQIGSTAGSVIGSFIAPGVGTAVGGAIGGLIGGLFGSGKDKTPTGPSAAEQEYQKLLQEYKDVKFKTTNPYEDMQVNLQAAEFQRDMQAQSQADALQALRGAGGAAGAAALATAMSRQAAEKERAIAASIGEQEQKIQLLQAEQAAKNEAAKRAFEIGRMETMLGISMGKVTAEEQARVAEQQAKMNRSSQLMGAGLSVLGSLGSSFIESGGLQPRTIKTFGDVNNAAPLQEISPISAGNLSPSSSTYYHSTMQPATPYISG
tara:strand:- start:94 stop:951 length:858 start_codon:yes stop_codon:yes gene_type:complete